MKLRRIELEQVRKFEGRVAVDGIGDGLNLIVGANEAGKTTLLAALQAGLFLKHSSSRARDLQHHRHETAPRIALEVEIEGERLHLEKRFLQRPQAVLRVGGTNLTGDAAEQAFSDRLRGGGRPGTTGSGIWNLLLVGQGQSIQHVVAPDARGVLQASLEAQVDGVTGSGSIKDIIGRLEDRLSGQKGLIERRSQRPKGRFRDLDQELVRLDARLAELDGRRQQLAADLARLETMLREQAAGPGPMEALEAEIRSLQVRETSLVQQAEAATASARAALALNETETARARRTALVARHDEMRQALRGLEAVVGRTSADLDSARSAGEALAAEASRQDELLKAAEAWLGAAGEAERVRAAAVAGAVEVTFDLVEQGPARLRLNGDAPGGRRFRVKVSDQLTIDVAEVGRVGVRPAQADAFARALRAIDTRAAAVRATIEGASQGEPMDFSDTAAFSAGLERLRHARGELGRRLEDARTAYREARADAVRAVRDRVDGHERLQALERELADARALVPDEALEAALVAATAAAQGAAPVGSEVEPEENGDLKAVRDRLNALREERESAGRHRFQRQMEIATLSERVTTMQGQGLREEIEELLRKRTYLAHERSAMAREVEVLRLLHRTLADAEREVRESYTAPLVARLQPSLDLLLPGAEVSFDDALQIRTVIRDGVGEEPFPQLSHGIREQLAVATRLAFAEVLTDAGRPCFVVLDDALVFADDDRLERMFRILERVGRKVQILILTCRERAFSGLFAKRLAIERVAADPDPLSQPVAASRLA